MPLVIKLDDADLLGGLDRAKKKLGELGVSYEALTKAELKAQKAAQSQERQFKALEKQLDPVARKQQQYAKAVGILDRELQKGTINQKRYNDLLRSAQGQLSAQGRTYRSLTDSLLRYAAAYVSLRSAIGVIRELADAQMQLERIQSRLRVASGGDESVAGFNFDYISQQAKRLGLDLESTASSFSKLAAAASTAGVSGDTTRAIFVGVAEASAAMGLSSAEAEGALIAIEQMMSKGRVSAEELRQQLGERLPGAFNLAAKAMGVSAQELDKMLRLGQVTANDLLPRLAVELHNAFGSEAEQNVTRLTGASNNLKTALFELKVELIEGGAGKGLVGATNAFTDAVRAATKAVEDLKDAQKGHEPEIRKVSAAYALAVPGLLMQIALWTSLRKKIREAAEASREASSGGYQVFDARKVTGSAVPERVLDEQAMHRAITEVAKGLEKEEAAAEKLRKTLAQYAEDLKTNVMPTMEDIIYNELPDAEEMFERIGKATAAQGDEWQKLRDLADAAFDPILDGLEAEYEELTKNEKEWAKRVEQINEGFYQEVGKGVHDALLKPLDEFRDKLVHELPPALQPFADALLSAASEWLAAMLVNIAKAKIAAKGIGSDAGGGGGGGGLLGAAKGLFGGGGSSGGALAGVSWVGVAAFAAIAAYGVWRKHQRDSENKKQYEFAGSYSPGGSVIGGNQSETGRQAVAGLQQLYAALQETLKVGTKGLEYAAINVRRDHALFEARVGQEIIGRFKTLDEAVLAASAKAFEGAVDDPAVKQVLKNAAAKFLTADELIEAVGTVKGLTDLASGISELGSEIKSIGPSLDALRDKLKGFGLDAAQVERLVAGQGLKSFADAWRSISGEQQSPAELRKQKEAERQILLAEMMLERSRLLARKQQVEAALAIARGEVQLEREVIDTRSAFIRGEDELWRIEGKMFGQYLQGRGELVGLNADILQAELDAISQYLEGLDVLIGKVSIGKIRIGNFGGGGRGGGLGGSREDRLRSALERLISAITRLREFQEEMLYDQTISPLTVAEQFKLAQGDYMRVLAAARGGDVQALENLPDAARRYLELAAQMFGTAGGGYGQIFQGVQDALQQISDQYPQTEDFHRWLRSDMNAVKDYLRQIRNQGRTTTTGGGGGGGNNIVAGGGGQAQVMVLPVPPEIREMLRQNRDEQAKVREEVKGLRADLVRMGRKAG